MPEYGHQFATSRPIMAAHKKLRRQIIRKRKEESIYEKKFIYRNGEAA
jgi:hypothetical protein